MDKLKVGSLFSGAGMLDLGLEWAGMETLYQVEIDPWNQHLLEKNWPQTIKYTDIKKVNHEDLPRVDVLAGGFPCQPVSVAGKKKAQEDERWLWPEFARIIRDINPKFVLVENVPGLLSRGFGEVLADLSACGYDAEWTTFPAAFVGSPHQRDRLWLVAYQRDLAYSTGKQKRKSTDQINSEPIGRHSWKISSSTGNGERENLADSESIGMEGYRTDWFVIPPAPTLTEIFRRYRTGRGKDYWAVEPELGRLANGPTYKLDRLRAQLYGEVPKEQEINAHQTCIKSARSEGLPVTDEMRILWEYIEFTEASSKYSRCFICSHPLSAMPCAGACFYGNMGQRAKEDIDLRCMREGIYSSLSFESWKEDLFEGLPERVGKNIRREAMGRRVNRLWSLGNGVVPQVAEVIGRLIIDANNMAS